MCSFVKHEIIKLSKDFRGFVSISLFYILNFYYILSDRAVTESINQLINVCTVSAPGQEECDNALRQTQVSNTLQCVCSI